MDRTEFIERIFTMFPLNFNDNNIPYWIEAYEKALCSPKINFDKLFESMVMNWTSMSTAPSPKWFIENQSNAIERDERCAAVLHMEEIRHNRDPIPEDVKARMEALKAKMSMGVR